MALADLDNDGDLDVIMNSLNDAARIYRNESSAPRVAVRLKGAPPNTRGIGARILVRGGAVPLQSQEMMCGGRYLSGDDNMRVFAAGSITNQMRIEVLWRSGKNSVLTNVAANWIYEIDEAGASALPPATGPSQGASKNVPTAPANTEKTVETVKKLRDPDATPLKRGVNEIEPSFSSAPWPLQAALFSLLSPLFSFIREISED